MLCRLTASLAALALAGCSTIPVSDGGVSTASAALPGGGAVSSADPRAQAAGEAMLRLGGNATDAAIATMLALTVVEPQSSGIGGGGLLVRGQADGKTDSYDGREKAPAGATPDWFLVDGAVPPFEESVHSGLSVGVPGNIALAAKAHADHGKLAWATLFGPAIKLAREGFEMNPRLVKSLSSMPDHAGWSATARALYFDPQGQVWPAGHRVVNEELARTFENLAAHGAEAFYKGPLAAEIAATVAAHTPHPGAMTPTDVASYAATERDPVCGDYRAYRVCSMGPPTSGGVAVIQILTMLERFDLKALGVDNPVTWHLFSEAQRLAYADRELYLADPDFVRVPVAGLIDRSYLARRSALIDPAHTLGLVQAGNPPGASNAMIDGDEPEEHGTSHIAVVDADGTMVSYTSTVESPFGSGLMAGGFYLNNELTDFSRSPLVDERFVANRVEGGKRPRSSMAPTVVWDPQGRPFLVVGAAGGSTIPVQTARSIIGAIDFGLSARDSIGLPFIMARGDTLVVEQGTWMERAIPAFVGLGHIKTTAQPAGVKGGAILRTGGGWSSAHDPRIDNDLVLP